MPQLQSLTVQDGKATPVNHVFVPKDIDRNGVARLKESNGVPLGDNMFTFSLRETNAKYKGRLTLTVPVVVTETINGVSVPKVQRAAYVDVTCTFDQASSVQERKDAMTMMANAMRGLSPLTAGTYFDLEGIY